MKAKLLMTASLVVCFFFHYPGRTLPTLSRGWAWLFGQRIGPIRINQFDGIFDLRLFDQPTLQVRYMKSDLWTFRFDLAIDGLSAKETTNEMKKNSQEVVCEWKPNHFFLI